MNKTTKPINLLLLLPITLLTILFLFTAFPSSQKTPTHPYNTHHLHIHNHLQIQAARSHCDGTLYPDLCVSTLSTLPDLHRKSVKDALCHTINVTESEVKVTESEVTGLKCGSDRKPLTLLQRRALDDCIELLDGTMDELKAVYNDVNRDPTRKYADLQSLLSAAMTNAYTCLDGFAVGSNRTIRKYFQPDLVKVARHVSNSLVMLKKVCNKSGGAAEYGEKHDDLEEVNRVDRSGFPAWMKRRDRHLLQAAVNGTKVDVVVAQDGSGNFSTIMEAVAAARNKSATRFVIYIKAGAYYENVEVDKKKMNIMFLGDGIGKTWIKGNRSVVDGWTTFRSAVLAVTGKGFIAKGITVENYAGPAKHQAVALRSGSDLSAFFQCSFVGYQDTLYVHSLRQFYRECDIYGTVDFVFGNAAVVFQNCSLYARLPLENQKNIYTAQGREDPNQNTGISILNCKVAAAADLAANKSATRTYLGRPWKEFSRTVIMLSYIEDVVDHAGWLEWNGTFALNTLYYGEYKNSGPGANTTARVTWPGYRVITNSTAASMFTVANFIEGGVWLPSYEIPFYPNLTSS
ncbi:hypothetical protein Cgig2_020862 [Carnegiea gigantea]|uniref:Pectinesterase n=1 Tax=Carnegiea gigantea TaxID=171969 RepID=A0A9Q1QJN9_9CARY|nr:hypothetical protein Cgig2_020862 [Carnegiea gigantea]